MEAVFHSLRPQYVSVTVFKLLSILSFNSHNHSLGPAMAAGYSSTWQLKKATFKDLSIFTSYISSKRQSSNLSPGVHHLASPLQLSKHICDTCSSPVCRGSKARGPGLSCKVCCWPCGIRDLFPLPVPLSCSISGGCLYSFSPLGMAAPSLRASMACFSVMFSQFQRLVNTFQGLMEELGSVRVQKRGRGINQEFGGNIHTTVYKLYGKRI